jgi:hypothetical protein
MLLRLLTRSDETTYQSEFQFSTAATASSGALISFINISADVSKPTCCHPPESLFLFLVQVLQSVENN